MSANTFVHHLWTPLSGRTLTNTIFGHSFGIKYCSYVLTLNPLKRFQLCLQWCKNQTQKYSGRTKWILMITNTWILSIRSHKWTIPKLQSLSDFINRGSAALIPKFSSPYCSTNNATPMINFKARKMLNMTTNLVNLLISKECTSMSVPKKYYRVIP